MGTDSVIVFIFAGFLLTVIHFFTGWNHNSHHLLNPLYPIYSLYEGQILLVPCFSLKERPKTKQNKNWNTKTGVLRHLYCNLIISQSNEKFQTGRRWTIIGCSKIKISLLCKKEVYRMNLETVSEAMEKIRCLMTWNFENLSISFDVD